MFVIRSTRRAAGAAFIFAAVALLAACGGGGTTPATSSATPTPSPSGSPSGNAEFTFGGSSQTVTVAQGQSIAVNLKAYHGITVSGSFFGSSSATTVVLSDATNQGDVTPNTLPADNAAAGYNAGIYISIVNQGSQISTSSATLVLTDTNGFGGATTCSLDVYGGSPASWSPSGLTATISGQSVTFNSPQGPQFGVGQSIIAISCK